MEKNHFSIRAILLGIIATLNLLIAVLVGAGVFKSWRSLEHATYLQESSQTINLLYEANKHLSLARGAALSVANAPPQVAEALRLTLDENRTIYEKKIEEALARIGNIPFLAADAARVKEKYEALQVLHLELDGELAEPPEERDPALPDRAFEAGGGLIGEIHILILNYSRSLRKIDATVARNMIFKNSVWELTEYAGQEYALIGRLIVEEKPVSPEQRENLISLRERILYGWQSVQEFLLGDGLARVMAPYMEEAESHYFESYSSIKDFFYDPMSQESSYPINVELWLEMSSQAVDSLLVLQDAVIQQTQNHINKVQQDAQRDIMTSAVIFFCAVALSLYCWHIIVSRVTRPINAMVEVLYKATQGEDCGMPEIAHRHDEIGKLATVLEAFQDNTRKIKQSNEELERYAYITAHDLKSPLRAIDNLSQWIEEDLGAALTGKTREHMTILRQRVRRMEKLLNDILEFSRITQQAQPANSEIINGRALVEDAVSLAAPPAGFTIRIGDGFRNLELERTPLQQVFFNLINNAIKHHDKAAGTIEIDAAEEADRYVFSVGDDGPGIPPEYHERIFDMFQTLKPRDQREGSGMGLAFVRKILTTRGGAITLESRPGAGSLFRFTWPKADKERKNERMRYA